MRQTLDVYSLIFLVVFGVAFVVAATSAICKYTYEKRMIAFILKERNGVPEEQETSKRILGNLVEEFELDVDV